MSMDDILGLICAFSVFFFLIGLGFLGGMRERRHIRKLEMREQNMADMFVTQVKYFSDVATQGNAPQIIFGEAVISTDYLKTFLSGWKGIFGGEMINYGRLLERARREATLRILEQARREGYNAVCNMRYETADLAGIVQGKKAKAVSVAVLACGTAYCTGNSS